MAASISAAIRNLCACRSMNGIMVCLVDRVSLWSLPHRPVGGNGNLGIALRRGGVVYHRKPRGPVALHGRHAIARAQPADVDRALIGQDAAAKIHGSFAV